MTHWLMLANLVVIAQNVELLKEAHYKKLPIGKPLQNAWKITVLTLLLVDLIFYIGDTCKKFKMCSVFETL